VYLHWAEPSCCMQDIKKVSEDIAELKPTLFVGVPRVFDRITTGLSFLHITNTKRRVCEVFQACWLRTVLLKQRGVFTSLIQLIAGIQQRIAAAGNISNWLFNFGFSRWVLFQIELISISGVWKSFSLMYCACAFSYYLQFCTFILSLWIFRDFYKF
jgi:hypothetical protein